MAARWLSVTLAWLLGLGGASRPLLDRAIDARGGPLEGLARSAEAEVYAGFPGTWRWRTAIAPDRYAWSILTVDETHHYLYDGAAVRAFVGAREVAAEPAGTAPLRTHARFLAVAYLDALRQPGVQIRPLSPEGPGRRAGAVGLEAVLADGAAYRLVFDDRMLLVRMSGPVSLEPFGGGELVAEFADFRRVDGYLLPYRTSYEFRGERVAIERALAVCPNPSGLDDATFAAPDALPVCE
jgi:hypothetical protein